MFFSISHLQCYLLISDSECYRSRVTEQIQMSYSESNHYCGHFPLISKYSSARVDKRMKSYVWLSMDFS